MVNSTTAGDSSGDANIWDWHINIGNLQGLPEWSSVPRLDGGAVDYAAVKAAGYSAVQVMEPSQDIADAGLAMSGMGFVTLPEQADAVAEAHKGWGFTVSTWHVGTGMETDAEMDALAGAVLEASARHGLPIHIETHRATITQDMRRTLDLIARMPDLTFNADLSHYYTGAEMPYGDIAAKFDRLQPLFERVRYLHGRIGTPCAMQVPVAVDDSRAFVGHFRTMWGACARGFAQTAQPGERLAFAPELLPYSVEHNGESVDIYYARHIDGEEESDRWEQAQVLREIARQAADTASRQAVPGEG